MELVIVTEPEATVAVHVKVLPVTSENKLILVVDPEQIDLAVGELVRCETGTTVTV